MAHYSNFNNRAIELPTLPAQPTEFERTAARLGLATEQQQKESHELKMWVTKHRNTRFVPEELLTHWDLDVNEGAGRIAGLGE